MAVTGSGPPTAAWVERYLGLLGVPRRAPGKQALDELVRAQLERISFENVSKLHYLREHGLRGLPPPELFLDGIDRFHFGGTCYANNYYLHLLLVALGYAARLCGASMSRPDVHLVNVVSVDGREYLVDGGYAAPFLAPLPRDASEDVTVELGSDRYVLSPQDGRGWSRMDVYAAGLPKRGYTVNPLPRRIDEFEGVIADSYRAEATFMNALLLARFRPGRSIVIHNLSVTESRGRTSRRRPLTTRLQLAGAVEESFGIPAAITDRVAAGLAKLKDVWA